MLNVFIITIFSRRLHCNRCFFLFKKMLMGSRKYWWYNNDNLVAHVITFSTFSRLFVMGWGPLVNTLICTWIESYCHAKWFVNCHVISSNLLVILICSWWMYWWMPSIAILLFFPCLFSMEIDIMLTWTDEIFFRKFWILLDVCFNYYENGCIVKLTHEDFFVSGNCPLPIVMHNVFPLGKV